MIEWPVTLSPVGPCRDKFPGLPNLGRMNTLVWRSGQPTTAGFWRMSKRGVKTVLSLRKEGPDDRSHLPGSIPLDFHRIAWEDEHAPPDDALFGILDVVTDSAAWPVLIHCLQGAGRTGVACAIIRHAIDGWPMEMARQEIVLYRPGFGPFRWPMARVQKEWLAEYARIHEPAWARSMLR